MKKLFFFIQGLFIYSFLALPAYAASLNFCDDTSGTADILCKLGGENIANTIQNVVVFFVMLAVVIALIYLLYGGIKWITSRGDKTQVEEARNHIMAAIVGLIVVFLAIFLLSIILAAFGIKFSELKIPVITGDLPIVPDPVL